MSEVVSDTEPVARKPHRCDDCARTIEPGEKYIRLFLLGDCGPYTWKRCQHCRAFIRLYYNEFADYDEGYDYQSIWDWEPDTAEALEHRRQWAAKWCNGTQLYPVPTAGVANA